MRSLWRPAPGQPGAGLASLLAVLAITLTACSAHQPQGPAAEVTAATQTSAGAPAAEPAELSPPLADDDWSDEVLYFVIVDRFADGDTGNDRDVDVHAKGTFHGGDLKGLLAHLDEIAGLGVTALWLTPLVQNIPGFVTGAGFPDWGYHGYWADDFYRLDARFGSEDDLRRLVGACHQRGIKVLLDVVYNHAGYDSHYLTDPQTRDWFRTEDRGTCGSSDLTTCVAGLPDLKTERPEVADFLMTAHLGLAQRTGLDGFRLDTVKHVDHPFWQQHRQRINSELSPSFFLLGEVWGGDARSLDPWFVDGEMNAGFDFSFQGSTVGFLLGRGRPVAYNRYLEKRHEVRAGYLLAHFLSSHDVDGALYQLQGDVDLFRLAALLQMTTLGLPTIYYGEEVGRLGGTWPDNRSDMPWGDRGIQPGAGLARNDALRRDYQRLIALRRAHPALWRGSHQGLAFEQDLLVFLRADEASGDAVVVAVNRGTAPAEARFTAPAAWAGRPLEDAWLGQPVVVEGDQVVATVPGRSARIFRVPNLQGG